MRPWHNIVLTGFMGTGKTTVGRKLAVRLGMEFVDTDALIEASHGPVSRIFERNGEAAFRSMEREVASELGAKGGVVIATGGRMVLDPVNFRALSRYGRIFCLVASPDEILRRLTSDGSPGVRPLLDAEDSRQRIVDLMRKRRSEYARFPQITTDQAEPSVIADEIARLWDSPRTYELRSPAGSHTHTVGVGILPFVRQLASIQGPMIAITSAVMGDLHKNLVDPDLTIVLPADQSREVADAVAMVSQRLTDAEADAPSAIVALGPEIIGHIAGLAAARSGRDAALVLCPTDLMAMSDTRAGERVGLKAPGRHGVGLHKQPKAVIADIATLQILSWSDLRSALSEVIELGGDAGSLLERLECPDRRDTLSARTLADLESVVNQTIRATS